MKKCFKCNKKKPLSEFYKHSQMADGYLNKCKECTKSDVKTNRYKNHEYYLAYDRKRFHENQERREYSFATSKRYTKKNPNKRSARSAISNAIRDGRIIKKPCEVCGCEKSEAHHEDYSKPLEVKWLCRKHHMELHRAF